jgi:hypothetical protein
VKFREMQGRREAARGRSEVTVTRADLLTAAAALSQNVP